MTVSDLIRPLNLKLRAHAGSLHADDRISALNAGQHKVWQLMVAAGKASRDNWFSKKATLAYTTEDTKALPVDFHSLLSASSTDVLMKASAWHRAAWQEDRSVAVAIDPTTLDALYYLVSGDFTPTLELSRSVTSLSVDVFYTSILPEWTDLTTNMIVSVVNLGSKTSQRLTSLDHSN